MSDTEINEAIECALGFKIELSNMQSGLDVINDGDHRRPVRCYASSLDACAEFEQTIKDPAGQHDYLSSLMRVMCVTTRKSSDMTSFEWQFLTANAVQRCEAYLRMKGLWNE